MMGRLASGMLFLAGHHAHCRIEAAHGRLLGFEVRHYGAAKGP